MKTTKELYDLLKTINHNGLDDVFIAVVKSVDKTNCVCDVMVDELEIGDVRLKATIGDGGKGLKVFPAIDSAVLVKQMGGGIYVVLMYSDIEDVLIEVGTAVHQITTTGHLIKNGTDTLKDALNLIIEGVQQIVVAYGNNPDYVKLQQASLIIQNLLV